MWNYVEHYLGPGLTNNQIYFTLLCCWLVIHEICRQHRLFSTDIEILLHVSLAELVSQDCSWSALNLCCFIIYWYCPKLIKKIKHLDMRHAQKDPKKECHFLSIIQIICLWKLAPLSPFCHFKFSIFRDYFVADLKCESFSKYWEIGDRLSLAPWPCTF